MAAALLMIIMYVEPSAGCPNNTVRQPAMATGQRGASLKLECTFDSELHEMKSFLIWKRRLQSGKEVKVYPSHGVSDNNHFHVDREAFHSEDDAGLHIRELTGRDSGLYLCQITILKGGNVTECRGFGTHLTVQATQLDKLIACCPLGVFIAALLVLHGLIYKQWLEWKKHVPSLGMFPVQKRRRVIRVPKISLDFSELISAL